MSRLAVLAAVAAAGAAGCGDDSGTEVDSTLLAPSKQGYISQTDGLCAFYQDRTERQARDTFGLGRGDFRVLPSGRVEFKPGKRPPDSQIKAFVTDTVVPNLQDELGELRAVQVPAGEEGALTAIYDQAESAADGLAADPAVALDSSRMDALFGPPLKSARAYGFRVCGARPPTVPAG